MDEIKLKPCPFCGGEMAIDAVPEYNMRNTMYFLIGKLEYAYGNCTNRLCSDCRKEF